MSETHRITAEAEIGIKPNRGKVLVIRDTAATCPPNSPWFPPSPHCPPRTCRGLTRRKLRISSCQFAHYQRVQTIRRAPECRPHRKKQP